MTPPKISVVILNFNGTAWLPRCLSSLAEQNIVEDIEIIIADNASTDGSADAAEEFLAEAEVKSKIVRNGTNFGYCEGNNRGARTAEGEYLLFLNTDTWLERDCLAKLLVQVQAQHADCASPLVLNYDDDTFQGNGARGFDVFGYLTSPPYPLAPGTIFAAPGCSLLVRKEVFERIGGFDGDFFMYADETDLAWRLALSGGVTITVPQARLHHRGAAAANPKGGEKIVEFRTNEMVRFFATRNSLLVLLKNAEHLLLMLCVTQCLWVLMEALAVLVITRRWSTVRAAYVRALWDIWRLRSHIARERRRNRLIRRHGDLWMLRFFRARLGRWVDLQKLFRLGAPKVNPSKF